MTAMQLWLHRFARPLSVSALHTISVLGVAERFLQQESSPFVVRSLIVNDEELVTAGCTD